MTVKIINNSRRKLPADFEQDAKTIMGKAMLKRHDITLIVKRSSLPSYYNHLEKRDKRFYDTRGASGRYHLDRHTITINLSKRPKRDDTRYVLAHEIGHLKQHIDSHLQVKITETYANKFAIQYCHCYPSGKYRGIKRLIRTL